MIQRPDNQFKHCRNNGSDGSHVSFPQLPTQIEFLHNIWERGIRDDRFTRYFAFFQGVLFVVAGCYFPQLLRFAGRCISPKYSLAFYGTAVGSLCIGQIASAMLLWTVSVWRFSYRCPHCHRRFLWKFYLTAGNHCPYCRQALYVSKRIGHLPLPEFTFYNQAYLCFLPVPMLICLACTSFIHEAPKALLYTQLAWIGAGILWIAVFPLFAWGFGKTCRRAGTKKRQGNVCLVCGEHYDPLILRLSGNCSACGSLLDPDWPPPEPEPLAILPTVRDVCAARQSKADIYVLLFLVGCWLFDGIQQLLPKGHLLQVVPSLVPWGFLVFFLYFLIRISRFWKILKPFRKCPYCHFGLMWEKLPAWNPNGRNVELYKYYFLRCPNCRRKLTRDDDAGKGDESHA